MLGTIVNTCTIIAGTLIGALLNRGIKDRYKEVLYTGLGLASLAIGLNATISNLPKSQYPVLFIVALAVGGVVGTALDIDGRFKRVVNRRSKSGADAKLGDGLSTAILLYCIGPLSMLGPVIAALKNDHTFLFTNATLDFVSSTIFASTYGLGMVLAAPVLFLWQGMFYLIAHVSSTGLQDAQPPAFAPRARRLVPPAEHPLGSIATVTYAFLVTHHSIRHLFKYILPLYMIRPLAFLLTRCPRVL